MWRDSLVLQRRYCRDSIAEASHVRPAGGRDGPYLVLQERHRPLSLPTPSSALPPLYPPLKPSSDRGPSTVGDPLGNPLVLVSRLFDNFVDLHFFSDFLGRLRPSKTTIQEPLSALGVEDSQGSRRSEILNASHNDCWVQLDEHWRVSGQASQESPTNSAKR